MRLTRTRVFGLFRDIYREIGEQLAFSNRLEIGKDIFYLTVEEIEALHEGRSVQTQLQELVSARKKEFQSYKDSEEPPHHFVTNGTVSYQNQYVYKGEQGTFDPDAKVLSGLGCYPGIVEEK